MVCGRLNWTLVVTAAALLGGLPFHSAPACAQPPGAPAASSPLVANDSAQNPPAQPGGQTDAPVQKDATDDKPTTPAPAYKVLRYDEDYSYLKDSARRTDFFDPIKYIPLGGREDWYLSLGGEIRERFEFFHNPDAGSGIANASGNNADLQQRYMLHGDLQVGPHLRFFGQLMTGLEEGRIGGPRPDVDQDVFDAHQAFVDVTVPLPAEKSFLTARLGRQEFEYGSGRLIDDRYGPNLPLSFDAARLLLRARDWQVDGWWGKPVLNRLGVFDDGPNPDRAFWGVYAVHPLPLLPQGNVDLYYLGFENKQAVYVQGRGDELRHSLGVRLWGKPMPWEYNLEYVWQFGTFGTGNIEAWTAANAVRYNFDGLPLKPHIGLRLDRKSVV